MRVEWLSSAAHSHRGYRWQRDGVARVNLKKYGSAKKFLRIDDAFFSIILSYNIPILKFECDNTIREMYISQIKFSTSSIHDFSFRMNSEFLWLDVYWKLQTYRGIDNMIIFVALGSIGQSLLILNFFF